MNSFTNFKNIWADLCIRYPPGQLELLCVIISQIIGYLIPSILYLLIDVVFPSFSLRHKIQKPQSQPSRQQIWEAIAMSLWNNTWPILLLGAVFWWNNFEHALFIVDSKLPSSKTIAFDFFVGVLAREISFYYIHRLLHHPRIYKYIHKKHHTYTAPISFAAEYAHPLEQIIANILPITLPLAIKGTHLFSFSLFAIFELWEAAADHSGYDFAKLPPAQIHDLHHEKFRVNYSTLGLMDWLHGTDVLGWDRPKRSV